MKITVRQYSEKDLSSMTAIWNEVVEEGNAFPQEEPLTENAAREFFAAQTCCGVAEDEKGRVQGLYILHPNNTGRCGHIANASYAVSSAARGQHIGEALVKDCIRSAAAHGYRILQFNAVVASNIRARALYEKLGFTALGTVPGGFRLSSGEYEDIVLYYIKTGLSSRG